MKRIFVLIAIAALMAVLAGCQKQEAAKPAEQPAAAPAKQYPAVAGHKRTPSALFAEGVSLSQNTSPENADVLSHAAGQALSGSRPSLAFMNPHRS